MIDLSGFLHRDALKALIARWMLDRPHRTDADALTSLVLFNKLFVARYLEPLTASLLGALHGCVPRAEPVHTKGALKDRIAELAPTPSPRTAALIAAYRHAPGLYYRDTPYRGTLYIGELDGAPAYLGGCRIKRNRRLAEKGARRIVDAICARAAPAASGQASPPSVDEAPTLLAAQLRAEAVFLDRLRIGQSTSLPDALAINDIAGIKLVLPPLDNPSLRAGVTPEDRLLRILADLGCTPVEREVHGGAFRALNLIVEHVPDKGRLLSRPLPRSILDRLSARAIDADTAQRNFRAFVEDGEPSVRVELIVSGYEDMLESEIGRCMHEDRIIRQRRARRYQGQLGENLAFLLEYLLTLPTAARPATASLPVRLWDRYLPDYFEHVRRSLAHVKPTDIGER
jgi:hypothetical protein